MRKSMRGFSLPELVIVIICLGILGTIGTGFWNMISTSSRDRVRETDVRVWAASFESYKNRYAAYPALPSLATSSSNTTLCLGTYTQYNNKCGQYNSGIATRYILTSIESSALLTEIKKVGNEPVRSGPPISNTLIGPLIYLTQTTTSGTVTVTARFINFFEGNCPSDFTNITSSLPASITGVLSGSNAKACALTKTTSFNPNPS